MLTHNNARQIASQWGEVNHTYKTNRKGAFYFSCSGHGGYIVDVAALTETELKNIDKYASRHEFIQVLDRQGKVRRFWHPFRKTTMRYYNTWTVVRGEFFQFEEDCDWSILEKFTDIRLSNAYSSPERHGEQIQETFNYWIDTTHPNCYKNRNDG